MSAILGLVGGYLIVVVVFAVLIYLGNAVGFYNLAKHAGIAHAWFAWIPILQYYLLGELINDKVFGIPYAKWILVLWPLVISIWAAFDPDSMVLNILSILQYVYTAFAFYELYKIYKPQSAVLYGITGAIITPLQALWVFLIRNNQRVTA